ncbi:hypothetical protein L917_06706 [Phytophthora nicotianae]|uniref:Uncharacterized protein n=1 Tax=Phytophthora nicotianae TaxID=4792 RepID=W2LFT0_PHYNI|nr:hypothetical protein L917_06706 [Phytophthora nicotianae]
MGPEASAPLIVRVLVHRNEREVIGRKRQLQPKKRAKTRLTTLHFYESMEGGSFGRVVSQATTLESD